LLIEREFDLANTYKDKIEGFFTAAPDLYRRGRRPGLQTGLTLAAKVAHHKCLKHHKRLKMTGS
jgi:hypothetical protein